MRGEQCFRKAVAAVEQRWVVANNLTDAFFSGKLHILQIFSLGELGGQQKCLRSSLFVRGHLTVKS